MISSQVETYALTLIHNLQMRYNDYRRNCKSYGGELSQEFV